MTALPQPTSAALDFRGWLGRAFLASTVVAALAYGSASTVQSSFAAIAFACIAMLSAPLSIGSPAIRIAQAGAILLAAALLAYAALQASPIAGESLANGAWKSVGDRIAPVEGTISVAPGVTLGALPALALPFLAYATALALFQGEDEEIWLWRALAAFGAVYAGFGVLQELFFPEQILLETKRFYVGSLTASFINRNTAGTFFGVAFLTNLGLLSHELRQIRLARLVKKTLNLDIGWPDKHSLALLHAFGALLCAVALFLTQSRGAVGATFVAATVAAALIAARPMTRGDVGDGKWRRRATALGGALIVVGLFALFAGRSVYRIEEAGATDARWCAFVSTLQAIKDNWPLGAGFGTFQDVFPVYRDTNCAGIFGVWERAHNVFLEGGLALGAPFLVATALGYAALIGIFLRGARTRHRRRFAPIIGIAALLLTTLHSMVDFSLQIPGFAIYFAAVMAAATSVSLTPERD